MNDEELRDLQERVAAMTDMTETQGWMLLIDAAAAAVENRQLHVLRGKCTSFEEYKSECEFAHGMQYLVELPARVRESLQRELELRREQEIVEDWETEEV